MRNFLLSALVGVSLGTHVFAQKVPYTSNPANVKTTASGLKYELITQGKGVKPKPGDKVKVHYHGLLADGTVFDSSVERGTPFEFRLGKGQVIKGWDEGIAYLSVGDKAILTVPPDLGYGAQARGKIPANATLFFHVELVNVEPGPPPFKPYAYDPAKLKTTASGLKYTIVEEGKGPQAVSGNTVKVHYHGTLPNGTVFDSSFERGEPIAFQLGSGQVIRGWDEGIALLKEGSKAVLVINPDLGYGPNGRGPIPPNTDMIFYVELVKAQ